MVSEIYPLELQLYKTYTSGTVAAFLDWHLSMFNNIVSTKIYYKRDVFDFDFVNCFARAFSYVADFNTYNKLLTRKVFKQSHRYHKLRKTFF